MRSRSGFTLIELIVVMMVIGVLAGIAILKYIDLTRTAETSKIVGDFVTIRLAAYNYEADHPNQWPPETGPGIAPDPMVPYLPTGFTFTASNYTLDWDNLTAGGGNGVYQLGIVLSTTDPILMNALVQTLGTQAPYYVAGNTMTYILIDPSGNY